MPFVSYLSWNTTELSITPWSFPSCQGALEHVSQTLNHPCRAVFQRGPLRKSDSSTLWVVLSFPSWWPHDVLCLQGHQQFWQLTLQQESSTWGDFCHQGRFLPPGDVSQFYSHFSITLRGVLLAETRGCPTSYDTQHSLTNPGYQECQDWEGLPCRANHQQACFDK